MKANRLCLAAYWLAILFGCGLVTVTLAQEPACVPVTYTARIDATEAELSQGDVAYLSLTVKRADGTFGGVNMVAGDIDTPIVQWLVRHRHKTVTLTLCGD